MTIASPALQLLMLLCRDCALRSGTAARVADHHCIDGHILILTKHAQTARTPITPECALMMRRACDAIERHHLPEDTPFTEALAWPASGKPWVLYRQWRKALKLLGLPNLRLHDLRRTMAVAVYNASGGDGRAVQSLLTHQHLATTMSYLSSDGTTLTPALAATAAESLNDEKQ